MARWMMWAWLGLVVVGCGGEVAGTDAGSCEDKEGEVEILAAKTFENMEPATADLQQLARAYADFANSCHDHPSAPEMLFRRADILLGLGKPQEALAQYRDVHDNFAKFDKRAQCAFLMGFIYDAHLGDRTQASKVYREVLNLHPQSAAAEWARQALVVLGERVEEEQAPIQIDLGF